MVPSRPIAPRSILAALAAGALLLAAEPARAVCPAGKVSGPDTRGKCCFPGQAWSSKRGACVGVPECPTGTTAQGETCVASPCPAGQVSSPDTAGHCCWPGQAWSRASTRCVGVPQCPAGKVARGEQCEEAAPPSPTPATGVPIRFVPLRDNDALRVSVKSGEQEVSCFAPCVLHLTPGPTRVVVGGDGDFETEVVVPSSPTVIKLRPARTGRLIYGLVGLGLGIPLLAVGIPVITGGGDAGGIVMTSIGGVAFLSGGIVLLTYRGDAAIFDPRAPAFTSAAPRWLGAGVAPAPGGAVLSTAYAF